jgi:hypothetical protein
MYPGATDVALVFLVGSGDESSFEAALLIACLQLRPVIYKPFISFVLTLMLIERIAQYFSDVSNSTQSIKNVVQRVSSK